MISVLFKSFIYQLLSFNAREKIMKFWPRKIRRFILDIDTQLDLVAQNEDWKHSAVIQNMKHLMAWSRSNQINVISTALAVRHEENGKPESVCIEGTQGQSKIHYTTLPSRIVFEAGKSTDLPEDLLENFQQVIFEKRTHDTFLQPRADRFLSNLDADEFIVIGSSLETSIYSTVMGLLSRNKKVIVVNDAVFGDSPESNELTLRKLEAKGAQLVDTDTIIGKKHDDEDQEKISIHSQVK